MDYHLKVPSGTHDAPALELGDNYTSATNFIADTIAREMDNYILQPVKQRRPAQFALDSIFADLMAAGLIGNVYRGDPWRVMLDAPPVTTNL